MIETFKYLIENCINIKAETVGVIYDKTTEILVAELFKALEILNIRIISRKIPTSDRHGYEPSKDLFEIMMNTQAIMCITKYSLAHTKLRNDLAAYGIPFLSMPDYDQNMIGDPSLKADYLSVQPTVYNFSNKLTECSEIHVISELGTDLFIDASGRKGNCCPGYVDSHNLLGSPPDIEANIAPVEENTHGVVVVDGSITDARVGLLSKPVTLSVNDGRITSFDGEECAVVDAVRMIFENVADEKAYIVGEFGVGFNDKAQLCGNMLIDEGTKGCIHFGIGSNWTIGGKNRVGFHLDFVMRKPSVFLDNECVIDKGEFVNERGY